MRTLMTANNDHHDDFGCMLFLRSPLLMVSVCLWVLTDMLFHTCIRLLSVLLVKYVR